jgi:hypothetical protein|tara:strand:+ start:58 stop:216 length:159 start_codon:yes stop_codon:yes gene_type:complete
MKNLKLSDKELNMLLCSLHRNYSFEELENKESLLYKLLDKLQKSLKKTKTND